MNKQYVRSPSKRVLVTLRGYKTMEDVRKILMLVENLPVPGDERVWSEAKTLRDAGFRVSVICPKGTSYFRESYVCLEDIHIYRYPLPKTAHRYAAYFM